MGDKTQLNLAAQRLVRWLLIGLLGIVSGQAAVRKNRSGRSVLETLAFEDWFWADGKERKRVLQAEEAAKRLG